MNKTATAYIIVTSDIVVGLSMAIQQHLLRGWQPIGGVSFDGRQYLQSMVRYKDEENVSG